MTCWLDGRLVPAAAATVSVLSNAVFRGTTVFDVMAVVDTSSGPAVVGLRQHLERFVNSMLAMHMTPAVDADEMATIVAAVIHANPGSGIVRVVAYWDGAPYPVPADLTPRILVAAEPNVVSQRSSISLQSAIAKIDPVVLPTQIKVAAMYAGGVRAQIAAQLAGFDAIVNRSHDDVLEEGVSSSVVLVVGGRLVAPPLTDVLDSITRRLILEAAVHDGIEVEVALVPWSHVVAADAAFMSSTTAPIVPIERIDDVAYRTDHPVIARLQWLVGAILSGDHQLADRWLTVVS
jgi:branched-subunit amino acid aminotransferase/4-amino-4-deoxychorismate lyase